MFQRELQKKPRSWSASSRRDNYTSLDQTTPAIASSNRYDSSIDDEGWKVTQETCADQRVLLPRGRSPTVGKFYTDNCAQSISF